MKILKKIMIIVFIMSFLSFYPQDQGKIKKVIYNMGLYKISESKNSSNSDFIEKLIANQKKIQFELIIDNESSLYKIIDKIEETENMDYKIASIINGGTITYYKNNKTQEKLYQAELQGQKFNIKVAFNQYKWEISNEYKFINEIKCFKATTTLEKIDKGKGTSKIYYPVAWFAPDIPLTFGPLGLDGLPGLVMEASIDGIKYFYSSKIVFESEVTNIKLIKPDDGINVSETEFEDINAKIYNDIQKNK